MKKLTTGILVGGAAGLAVAPALAASPQVKIYESGSKRCIESNGVPNHSIGQFPNSGNPHSFRTQRLKMCFPKTPKRKSTATENTPNVGIALNGILIRPGTADWYDPNSRRGFSRDRSSGWNLEGMGASAQLGMDRNNAHVDERGLYHYHGRPPSAVSKGTLIGYAADGFEIHYVGSSAQPSWMLKQGTRPSGPGGKYDGTYIQDWEYKQGSGNLDKCNGKVMNGKYVYFATDTFPFYPRCHWGTVSSDFKRAGGNRASLRNRGGGDQAGERPRRRGLFAGFGKAKGGPLAAAAAELGVSERQLAEAVGAPPPNFRRASRVLSIPEVRVRQVMLRHRPR